MHNTVLNRILGASRFQPLVIFSTLLLISCASGACTQGPNSPSTVVAVDHDVVNSYVIELKKRTEPSLLREIMDSKEGDLSKFHLSLGLQIRNENLRGKGNVNSPLLKFFQERGLSNYDDMSRIVIASLWRSLHSMPTDVSEQVDTCLKARQKSIADMSAKKTMPQNLWDSELKLGDGTTFPLSKLQGKPLLLVLTAQDPNSQLAVTEAEKLYNKYHSTGLQCLVVPVDAQSLIPDMKLPYVADRSDRFVSSLQGSLLGGIIFPTAILIDRSGVMTNRFNEFPPWDKNLPARLEQAVSKLMADTPNVKSDPH